jgi:hypothetical protein
MEHGFTEEMVAQEDAVNKTSGQEGWMAKIRGSMSGDEGAEPFQFNPRVHPIETSLI